MSSITIDRPLPSKVSVRARPLVATNTSARTKAVVVSIGTFLIFALRVPTPRGTPFDYLLPTVAAGTMNQLRPHGGFAESGRGVQRSRRYGLALIAVVAIGIALLGPFSGSAHAGTVAVTGQVQGAGSIVSVEGGPYECGTLWNTFGPVEGSWDDRVTYTCGRQTFGAVFVAFVRLRAHAPSYPGDSHWRFVGWQGCDEVQGTDCIVKSGAFSLDERRPKAIFDDYRPPTVTRLDESFSSSTEKTVSITSRFDEPLSMPRSVPCRLDSVDQTCPVYTGIGLDGGPNPGTTLTKTFANEGPHTFEIRGIDRSGNDGAWASRSFEVIDTALTGGPTEGSVSGPRVTFDFSTVGGAEFECSLDGAAFAPCGAGKTGSHSLTSLGEGSHTVRVRARHGGWFDHIPAQRTWTVDATPPPAPQITSPTNNSYDTDGGFAVTGTAEPASSIQLYEGTTPRAAATAASDGHFSIALSGVPNGSHTYTTKASDGVGNESSASDPRTVIVDTVKPTVIATSPRSGATGVSPTANVLATFSEAVRAASISGVTVKLVRRGTTTPVTANVSYNPTLRRAKLDPSRALKRGATYTATVTTGVMDLAGNPLATKKAWSFKVPR